MQSQFGSTQRQYQHSIPQRNIVLVRRPSHLTGAFLADVVTGALPNRYRRTDKPMSHGDPDESTNPSARRRPQ
jgi:hypothetical protein